MNYYEYHCERCGGFVGEPNKAYGYAGQWCHCTEPIRPTNVRKAGLAIANTNKTLLERLQREAREKFEELRCVNYAMYTGCVDEVCDCGGEKCRNQQTTEMAAVEYTAFLNALIAHTLKEAAKEIEKKKVLNGCCGYSFTGQTIDIKSAVECIHGAERKGYNQALTDAQKVLTAGTSQTK